MVKIRVNANCYLLFLLFLPRTSFKILIKLTQNLYKSLILYLMYKLSVA